MRKAKPSHSLISNTFYVTGLLWKHSKLLLVFLLALIPVTVGISFCNIYLPKLVVAEIIGEKTATQMVVSVASFGAVCIAFNLSAKMFETYMYTASSKFNREVLLEVQRKALETDYEIIESSKYRLLMDRATQVFWMSGSDSTLTIMPKCASRIVTNTLGYLLFGTVLTLANPLIALLLTVAALTNYLIVKAIQEYQHKHRNDTSLLDKKMWYITRNSGMFDSAKDVRLYGMNTWFVNMYKALANEKIRWERKFAIRHYKSNVIDAFIILLRDGFAYAILIAMVIDSSIRIDEFILYFGAVSSFAGLLGGIITEFVKLNDASLSICNLRDHLLYGEKDDKGEKSDIGIIMDSVAPPEIDMKSVTYRYEGASSEALTSISLKIKNGEKIAIVGLNGAGKTTLIKNICGLYHPTNGSISINGRDVNEFSSRDRFSLFSIVFQDHHFLPVSVANTVSCVTDELTDRVRVLECIEAAGLEEKIKQLPEGIDSMLDKRLNKYGVDLSEGEKQKLLLARAIYKDAPILILDEPTSALDPIAESELYQKYSILTSGKTSIYISHRLASTRFCDRILLIEGSRIAESGNHSELMRMGGKYAYLYNIQSKYYRDSVMDSGGRKEWGG